MTLGLSCVERPQTQRCVLFEGISQTCKKDNHQACRCGSLTAAPRAHPLYSKVSWQRRLHRPESGGGSEEAEQSKPPQPPRRAQLLLGMSLAWKPGRLHLLYLFHMHPPGMPHRLPKRFSCSEAAYKGQALFVSKSSAGISLP